MQEIENEICVKKKEVQKRKRGDTDKNAQVLTIGCFSRIFITVLRVVQKLT